MEIEKYNYFDILNKNNNIVFFLFQKKNNVCIGHKDDTKQFFFSDWQVGLQREPCNWPQRPRA